jgi:hypothetical protein
MSTGSHDFWIRVTRILARAGTALMTRRPALPCSALAVALHRLWSKVSRGGGSKRPQFRLGFLWLLLAAGLLFFLGHAISVDAQVVSTRKRIDRCASRHVPAAKPPS